MRDLFAAATMILGIGVSSAAADPGAVSWSNSVEDAWRTAGSLGRPMIVFVTRTGCLPCARMKTMTFVDRRVTGLINDRFVAVTLDGAQPTPLLNELKVHAVPATFVISPEAKILARFDGYLAPEALVARLAALSPSPPPQPSPTARAF